MGRAMAGIKLAIFDWDGTVHATTHRNFHSSAASLKEIFGLHMSWGSYRDRMAFPTRHLYIGHGVPAEVVDASHDRMVEVFSKNFHAYPHATGTTPGVRKLLHWLHARAIPCVIASNHDTPSILADLRRLNLRGAFREVSGRDPSHSIQNGSSKEKRVKEIIENYGFSPQKVVIFGDSLQEIAIAHALGLRSIALGCGDTAPRRLVQAHPDAYVPTPAHAIPVLQRWCQGAERVNSPLGPRAPGC